MASEITSVSIVFSTICSGSDQTIHWWQVNFPHKGPVTRKMFPFDDVNMTIPWICLYTLLPQYKLYHAVIPSWCLPCTSRWQLPRALFKIVCVRNLESYFHEIPSGSHYRQYGMIWWCHQMETFFRVTGHWCGEFTGDRWIPLTKASNAELWCVFLSAPD